MKVRGRIIDAEDAEDFLEALRTELENIRKEMLERADG